MSVTIRQAFRTSFGTAIPILTPLYSLDCDALKIAEDGEFDCGTAASCRLPLQVTGIAKQHCTFKFSSGALTVRRDEGRVWVNEVPVGHTSELKPGDLVTVGPLSFQVGQFTPVFSSEIVGSPVEPRRAAPSVVEHPVISHALFVAQNTNANTNANTNGEPAAELSQKLCELEQREKQVLELSNIIRERERSVAERQQTLEERAALLNEQKAAIEQQQNSFSALEESVRRQKEDMDSRLRNLMEREVNLASQIEASANSYAQLEQSRLSLAQQLENVEQRSLQLTATQNELSVLAAQLEASRQHIASAPEEFAKRSAELADLAAQLDARASALLEREQAAANIALSAQSEAELRQRALAQQETTALALAQELRDRDERLSRTQQELETLRAELSQQKTVLEAQSVQLIARSAELDAQAAEIAASRLAAVGNSPVASETRSVGQLAAIAAEREAAVRAKQEAFQAQAELNTVRTVIAAEESRLAAWQKEIDSRSEELAIRVVDIKRARRKQLASSSNATSAEQAASLQEEWQKLAARHGELDVREAQIDELQSTALSMTRAAEAEREALQNSHKNLLCERNSLTQLSQDLQKRESGLLERESHVSRQMDELRSRFDALTQQTAAHRAEEAELDARAAELHRRIAQFNAEAGDRTASSAEAVTIITATGDEGHSVQLTESVKAMEAERDAMTAERDALLTAVRELQRSMQNAKTDVEEASRVRSEYERQQQTIDQLYQTVEEKSGQLQLTESRFRQTLENLEELQGQIAELISARDAEQSGTALMQHLEPSENSDEQEILLLSQIESLRNELSASASADSSRHAEYQQELAERDRLVTQLRNELQCLRDEQCSPERIVGSTDIDPIEFDSLRSRLERANEVLRDRDDLIRELRARLMKQSETPLAEAPDRDQLQKEAHELDRRANLLDEREEEIREKARRISQSEEDVESQRRQLLDARQQLEIARAEIQVAMKQHGAKTPSGNSAEFHDANGRGASGSFQESILSSFGAPVAESHESENSESSHDLRAELANLFGLKKPPAEATSTLTMPVSDFIDLSEPAGESKAVAFRFGDDASSIVQQNSGVPELLPEATSEPKREENSDDFVRDYMEQLLSRSRKSAGNSLPNELKSPEAKSKQASNGPQSASNKKPEPSNKRSEPVSEKKGPKTKSFIEQYMSGGFGDLTGDGSMPELPPAENISDDAEADVTHEPAPPRVKLDRQKLRENMDSFRTLSTQSVENALVNHALRKERNSINGRITFIAVLVGMSIFLAIANVKGIIEQPSLIWVTLVAAIGAAGELARKFYSLKVRTKGSLIPEDAHGPTSSSAIDRTRENNREQVAELQNLQDPALQGSFPHPAITTKPAAAIENDVNQLIANRSPEQDFKEDEDDSSRYFEL